MSTITWLDWLPILSEKTCVLVTLAFLLTRTRLLPDLLKPRLSARDQVVAALLFVLIGLAEVAITLQQSAARLADSPLNLRIVAVAAAGLLAGPWVGFVVGIVVTVLASKTFGGHGMPLSIGTSMVLGGLLAGVLHDWKPRFAVRPLAGFLIGAFVSCFRDLMNLGLDPAHASTFAKGAEGAILQGFSVALILLVIAQARAQESQCRAAAMAEVRALQARMDPHFLFNSLNLLSALSEVDPRAVPKAAAHLGKFLRAAIDQHDQAYVSLQRELDVVDAYLEVESLRLGDRLSIRKDIDPRLLKAKIPPFLLQPLVENAVRHGVQPKLQGGTVSIVAAESNGQLLLTVADDGAGMASESRAHEATDGHVHALTLLQRRLEGLYGSRFQVAFESRLGEGTKISLRIPYGEMEPATEEYMAPTKRAAGLLQGGS